MESPRSGELSRAGRNTTPSPVVVTSMLAAPIARAARPGLRRPLAAVVGLAIIAGSAACSGPPASVEPVPSPVTATVSRDGVDVTLTLEEAPRSGVVTWVDVAITNGAVAPVRWAGGGCGDPAGVFIELRDAFDPGRDWPGQLGRFKAVALGFPGQVPTNIGYTEASKMGQNVACPASLSIEQLAPGAALRMRAGWDGTINGAPAPTGPATVSAFFGYIGVAGVVPNDRFETRPISVEIRTTVAAGVGGRPVQSPALAIDAALADPQFAAFVQGAPEATWINPDISWVDGTWNIGLFRRQQGTENALSGSVRVDQTGKIVARRFAP